MRLLIAHPEGDLYGADRMLLETVRGLRRRGADAVVCLSAGGSLVDEIERSGADVRIMAFSVVRQADASPRGLAGLARTSPDDLALMRSVLRSAQPHLVYVNTVALPHWLAAARSCGIPSVCHVREADPAGAGPLKRAALLSPLLLTDRLIANSHHTYRALRVVPGLRRKATVIHNGFAAPTRGREPVGGDPSPGDLVLLGRLNRRKGQVTAIRAVALLQAQGVRCRLRIVGDAYPGYEFYEDELRGLVGDLGLEGSVTFAGFRADRWSELRNAGIVVVPSTSEPFGNVAVEAMLCGRPVIASAVGGLREIVDHGQTGLLVTPADPTALARAIGRVINDELLASRLGAAGAQAAAMRFGPERYEAAVWEQLQLAASR